MKSILIFILGAAAMAAAQIIPLPADVVKTAARQEAELLSRAINDRQRDDVVIHKILWERLWENAKATPQEIFNELHAINPDAPNKVLLAGRAMVQHITASAELAESTAVLELGDAKYLTTKYTVDFAPDGKVTVAMPED